MDGWSIKDKAAHYYTEFSRSVFRQCAQGQIIRISHLKRSLILLWFSFSGFCLCLLSGYALSEPDPFHNLDKISPFLEEFSWTRSFAG